MIEYELRKVRAVVFDVDGVLSSSTVSMDADGQPVRTMNVKDGYAIQLAVKKGLLVAIISCGRGEQVEQRYEGLGVKDVFLGCAVKADTYAEFAAVNGLADSEVMYMGDDIPDLQVMRRVGCPVCPADACQEVKDAAVYVSPVNGGQGCARDVLEQTLKAQGKWSDNA